MQEAANGRHHRAHQVDDQGKQGRGQHGELPPNDWESIFGGPAWTRVPDGQWYLHLFDPAQPDLNWRSAEVRAEFEDILRFWLDRGVDGFRMDVVHGIVKRADLAEANYLKLTAPVTPGQQLMVPHETTVLMAARTDLPIPVADSRATTSDAVVPAVASTQSDRIRVYYQVKEGDTLASIAKSFKTTVVSLQNWNRIPSSQIRAVRSPRANWCPTRWRNLINSRQAKDSNTATPTRSCLAWWCRRSAGSRYRPMFTTTS